MKPFRTLLGLLTLLTFAGCTFSVQRHDDHGLESKVKQLEHRLEQIEKKEGQR